MIEKDITAIGKSTTCRLPVVNSIVLESNEFDSLIAQLTNGVYRPYYEYDGLSYEYWGKDDDEPDSYEEYVNNLLSEEFGVKVTSVHLDHTPMPLTVWITFKEI